MKIAVISDTHLSIKGQRIPLQVEKALKETDFIVHCGDFESFFVYEELQKLGKLVAVYGNMDIYEFRKILPEKIVFEAGGYKLGVIHGYGPPKGIEERVAAQFQEKVDVILYGHSHQPKNELRNEILFFNPGSPTDKIFAPFNSYGILDLSPEGVRGTIVQNI